jgi:hypothetical protein
MAIDVSKLVKKFGGHWEQVSKNEHIARFPSPYQKDQFQKAYDLALKQESCLHDFQRNGLGGVSNLEYECPKCGATEERDVS